MYIKIFFILNAFLIPFFSVLPVFAGEHGGIVYHAFNVEIGAGKTSNGERFSEWDIKGWVGGDTHKLNLKSEGEYTAGKLEKAEFWGLYSRSISKFWDTQIGLRQDSTPHSLGFFVFGLEGLAPYFLETEAHIFLSEKGDVSARLGQEKYFLLTQKTILEPYFEADFYAQDVPELDIGAGLSNAEIGMQLRHEITRSFAPYIDFKYDRKFGETSSIAKNKAEENDALVGTFGVKLLF